MCKTSFELPCAANVKKSGQTVLNGWLNDFSVCCLMIVVKRTAPIARDCCALIFRRVQLFSFKGYLLNRKLLQCHVTKCARLIVHTLRSTA